MLKSKLTSFTCPRCGHTSHNPHDVVYGYCGNCHDFTRESEFVGWPDSMGRKRTLDLPPAPPPEPPILSVPTREEIKEGLAALRDSCRRLGIAAMPWQGCNLYRAVHGKDAPAGKEFTLDEIQELCRRYVELRRGETNER